jgi:hypothetical protein
VKIEGDAFVIADPDHGVLFDQGVSLIHRAIHSLLMPGHFQGPPDRAVTVFLFSSHASFVKFSKDRYGVDPEGHLYGYYRRSKREILVDGTSGLPTLSHEIVHPYMQHEAFRLPAWIDEGLGSLYEHPSFSADGSMHGLVNWRIDDLKAALGSPDIASKMRLDALFGMGDREFLGGGDPVVEGRNYALARFVCQFLDVMAPGKLWMFLTSWRDDFENDPTGIATFNRVVGVSPAEANDAFLRWVRPLKKGSTGAPATL